MWEHIRSHAYMIRSIFTYVNPYTLYISHMDFCEICEYV